jgi:DNA-directed RNA polymerase specialized sigma24 family protein
MPKNYLYNNYLAMWRKMDERDEQARTPTIPVRPRMFIDQSVKSWRDRTALELLSDALEEALAALAPRDREMVIAYAECGSYAEVGRKIGRRRQGVKEYVDKLLGSIRIRIEASI